MKEKIISLYSELDNFNSNIKQPRKRGLYNIPIPFGILFSNVPIYFKPFSYILIPKLFFIIFILGKELLFCMFNFFIGELSYDIVSFCFVNVLCVDASYIILLYFYFLLFLMLNDFYMHWIFYLFC